MQLTWLLTLKEMPPSKWRRAIKITQHLYKCCSHLLLPNPYGYPECPAPQTHQAPRRKKNKNKKYIYMYISIYSDRASEALKHVTFFIPPSPPPLRSLSFYFLITRTPAVHTACSCLSPRPGTHGCPTCRESVDWVRSKPETGAYQNKTLFFQFFPD